ncbi:YlbE-like family protein [Sporolactobacillus kofuensis]|uniref:YlbE-like family protein n=1 Tax=Sporolactobacillus kofuensis TaxID=269672 RepID=A0ABW1WDG2_9BACL|nr:YlbE-like family protein [Sporolactobacillus kofuensis]MCO7174598.1 YlbE-like family protein [Sporolactobacillus kofuensis]
MRPSIQAYLDEHPDEKLFIRMNPEWYRRLSRSPWALRDLKPAADYFYGRTFSQKLDRFNQRAAMMSMLVSMAQAMTEQKQEEH